MQRSSPLMRVLACVCVLGCIGFVRATTTSNTGTTASPCTACKLLDYDKSSLYVYSSTEATVQTYENHFLQITTNNLHPQSGGTLMESQTVDMGPPPVTTFTMPELHKCEVLWYWCGAHESMQGGRVYVMPGDGSNCTHALAPTPAPSATNASAFSDATSVSATPAPDSTSPSATPNATAAPATPAPSSATAPVATGTTAAAATPAPSSASAPVPSSTPASGITYNLTIPLTHCHPTGGALTGVTLAECEQQCTDVACTAFSFYKDTIEIDAIFNLTPFLDTSCTICGFPTIVVNGTVVVVDGNHSSVLAPALLREGTGPYHKFNIYQPVHIQTAPSAHLCDASGVQLWLQSDIFTPVLAEANASAGGVLNATRQAQLLALLTANVAANLSHAAEDCSMPEVNTQALLDEARVVLLGAGAETGPCEAFTAVLASIAFAPALNELNVSMHGAFDGAHAAVLHALLELQFLPGLLANTSTCDPAKVSNATLEATAQAFASGLMQNPANAGLFVVAPGPADDCAALLGFLAQNHTAGMLQNLNATAGGALNATHAAALGQLVQQHLVAPLADSAVNCNDEAALSAEMLPRVPLLQLALAQHPLFGAYQTLPDEAKVVVEMTVRLGMSQAQFDTGARLQYRTGIASTCGVAVAAVRITAVRVAGAGRRRRLLQNATQDTLEVDTQIDTPATEALTVLAAAGNSTAVQEGVQAQMDADVQVETVSAPELAPSPEPAPSPTPSPAQQKPKPNYQGQNSATSTGNRSRNILLVAMLLLFLMLTLAFVFALSVWHLDKKGRVLAPGEYAQVPPGVRTEVRYSHGVVPEAQLLISGAVPGVSGVQPGYGYPPHFRAYP